MIRFLLVAAVLGLTAWLAPLPAKAQTDEQSLVDRATLALQDLMTQSVSEDPRRMLQRARAVMICPRVFKAGTAVSTELAHIPVMLWKTSDEGYRIFPRASFADFLGRWLLDAMREYASPEVP